MDIATIVAAMEDADLDQVNPRLKHLQEELASINEKLGDIKAALNNMPDVVALLEEIASAIKKQSHQD